MCGNDCSTTSCPFAYTDLSEQVQNYGCLPTPQDIIVMRVYYGKTWACHSNPKKPCVGGLKAVKEHGFDNTIIDKKLITENTFTKEITLLDNNQKEALRKSYQAKYIKDHNL